MPTDLETSHELQSTLDRIIRALDGTRRKLPRDAIREARQHREQIIPRLIQSIQSATAIASSGHVPEGNAHFYALFLLTEFQAREALPAIIEAISLPGELPFEMFGDAITESLPAILAALAVDRPELLDELIRNRSLNEYVRWAAADTFLYWVRDGRITRDLAVEHLRSHLREAIEGDDAEVATGLVTALSHYSPREALNELREVFECRLVDDGFISVKEVEESATQDESRMQAELDDCRPTGVQDTISELASWAAFSETAKRSPPAAPDKMWDVDWLPDDSPDLPITIRNAQPRIGRNDPCPCGSGKKFKKCCGQR
jgi:hypothetical protein